MKSFINSDNKTPFEYDETQLVIIEDAVGTRVNGISKHYLITGRFEGEDFDRTLVFTEKEMEEFNSKLL